MSRHDVAAQPRLVQVARQRWTRGLGPASPLYDDLGHMNVIGFVGRALGISGSDLMHSYAPEGPLWPEGIGDVVGIIQIANDEPHMPDAVRELFLTQMFGQLGISLEFVDE